LRDVGRGFGRARALRQPAQLIPSKNRFHGFIAAL